MKRWRNILKTRTRVDIQVCNHRDSLFDENTLRLEDEQELLLLQSKGYQLSHMAMMTIDGKEWKLSSCADEKCFVCMAFADEQEEPIFKTKDLIECIQQCTKLIW